jgi:glycosyltransferase involved in cell wall biosynthesis
MSNLPIVSVVMPVFNSVLYVRQAIDSILNQTLKEFELIIIDDASTDGTKEILHSYNDERIILIENEKNSGYVFGLNLAISIARGEFIARMDSDDVSLPNRLQLQLNYLLQNSDIVMVGSFYKIFNSERIIELPCEWSDIKMELLFQNPFGHPTVMFRRHFMVSFNLKYDINKVPAEDFDLWSRMSKLGVLSNIPMVLLEYRLHDQQISNRENSKQCQIAFEIGWSNFISYLKDFCNIHYLKKYSNYNLEIVNMFYFVRNLKKNKHYNLSSASSSIFYYFSYFINFHKHENSKISIKEFALIILLFPKFYFLDSSIRTKMKLIYRLFL